MFSYALNFAIAAMPLLATANPISSHNSTCDSGPVQCCDTSALVREGPPQPIPLISICSVD